LKLSFYEVKVRSNGKIYIIKLLAESSQKAYDDELESLKKKAEKAAPMLKRNAWVKYYNFKDKFADVKYNYALTVHKAQGSTFDNAIVINCDIKRMPNKRERDKLLYTAITRAKNKLFMVW
jgi:exodeoxyribonuclease-5